MRRALVLVLMHVVIAKPLRTFARAQRTLPLTPGSVHDLIAPLCRKMRMRRVFCCLGRIPRLRRRFGCRSIYPTSCARIGQGSDRHAQPRRRKLFDHLPTDPGEIDRGAAASVLRADIDLRDPEHGNFWLGRRFGLYRRPPESLALQKIWSRSHDRRAR
jgi:hypothetical protein